MMSLREIFLGNWRNKGVALFLATTIWFAAYRSEKQDYNHVFRVDFRPSPSDKESVLITSIQRLDPHTGSLLEFDQRVRMVFSGPRRQIDKFRDDPPLFSSIEVPRDQEIHTFTQGDFDFPRDGVEITQFAPEAVRIAQEESVKVKIENLAEKLVITNVKEGFEVASREVKPGQVQITGPRSLVASLGVSLSVAFDYNRDVFHERVDITPVFPADVPAEVVKRTVVLSPQDAEVNVVLRASNDVLPVEAMRISFRLPPVKSPIKIVLDDVVGETIPVEFYGRKDEIARLRDRLRNQPAFSLAVSVPPFDRELGGQFTFTEDSLELYGFAGVQIRQHELRRKEKKAGWSYSILPVKEAEK
jgi:hypothetical protein